MLHEGQGYLGAPTALGTLQLRRWMVKEQIVATHPDRAKSNYFKITHSPAL